MKRVARSLLCATLWMSSVLVSRTAAAQAPDAEVQLQVAEARRHFDALEYERAIPAADRAVALLQTRQGDAAKRTLADVLEIRARSRFGIGDGGGVRQDFILLLKADPRHLLSGQVSPRAVTIFDEAKRATVTTLRLTLTPPNATVLLDGTQVDSTGDIFVLVGPHTVSASRLGYDSGSDGFTADPDKINVMALALRRSSAVLSVVTAPADVEVFVDGISRGKTIGPLPSDFTAKAAAAGITRTDASGVLTLAGVVGFAVLLVAYASRSCAYCISIVGHSAQAGKARLAAHEFYRAPSPLPHMRIAQ